MAWTTPRTWTTGELVTATIMNAHIRDNLDYLKNRAGEFAIVKSTTQDTLAGSDGSWVGRSLSSVTSWDTSSSGSSISWLSLTSNTITLSAGTYLVNGLAICPSDTSGTAVVRLYDTTNSAVALASPTYAQKLQVPIELVPGILAPAGSTNYVLQSNNSASGTYSAVIGFTTYTYLFILRLA